MARPLLTEIVLVEDLVKMVAQSIEEHNTSHDATTTSNPNIDPTLNQPM
jgi:hypothetical protein